MKEALKIPGTFKGTFKLDSVVLKGNKECLS